MFLGWVPPAIAGRTYFLATGKLTFAPWTVERAGWIARPITLAGQLTYTLGGRFSARPEGDLPPTALRAGLALGAATGRRVGGTAVLLYAELVALDAGIFYWVTDRTSVGLADVLSLALGVRVEL